MQSVASTDKYSFVGGPFGSNLTSSDYVESPGVPVIRGINLDGKNSRFVDDEFVFVSDNKAESLVQNMAYPGDLVFTQRGTLGQVAEVPLDARFPRYVVSQSQMKLAVNRDLADPRYLYHYYRSPLGVALLESRIQATGVPHINLSLLKEFPVVLPPLPEQKRIAAILDKADAIRRKRQEAIRLTEELLRSAFLEMFGDPVTNPKGWELRKLGEMLDDIASGWSPVCEARPAEEDEWAVLKLGCVTYGRYNPRENKAMTPDASPRPELEVKTGDLLFSRKNTLDLVGATAYVFDTPGRRTLPDTVFRLVLNPALDAVFLWQLLSHPGMRAALRKQASGTAGSMPNISKARLRSISVPMPPKGAQLQFRDFVYRVESTRARSSSAESVSNELTASVVSRAFSGRL